MNLCRVLFYVCLSLVPVLLFACGGTQNAGMSIVKQLYGMAENGTPVDVYTLTNANGLETKITNYGATVISLKTPGRNGVLGDVVLGYDTLEEYIRGSAHFGCIVGRYANRIGKARFTLNGIEYSLAKNNAENHLHGGIKAFDKVVWDTEEIRGDDGIGLKLTYLSRDGEEGYPGNLSVTVTYTLTNSDELKIDYLAETDRDTVVNLSNHTYFNLSGEGKVNILGHELMINADKFTPVDEGLIPTGEIKSVHGTPLDFTTSVKIGARIDQDHEQLNFGGGYDLNWVLNNSDGSLGLAARVYEPTTGRVMEVYTTEPGVQFYSGNFLNSSVKGKNGKVYDKHYGFCLETQHFPDSPNKPDFPSTVLRPSEKYTQTTIYRFSTK